MKWAAVTLWLFCAFGTVANCDELLHPLFHDHAVLQRDRPARIWGTTAPNAAITVSIATAKVTARAGADGSWQLLLPALKAGGPHELTVVSSAAVTQTIHDVLIGDVWLCSGQSNMEMPVRRVMNSDTEIADSTNNQIRLLTVQRTSSAVPLRDFAQPVAWTAAAPGAIDEFAATCYFFGRDLYRANGVPQGLIHSSWGGSTIQAWISAPALSELRNYGEALQLLDLYAQSPQQADVRWRALMDTWWKEHDPAGRNVAALSIIGFDDSAWPTLRPEGFWEKSAVAALHDFDGIVWFRKTFDLSAQQARDDATLSLGPIDDADVTWVNGKRIGSMEGWDTQRVYVIPRGVLRAGKNAIAVAVLDSGGGGGMWGPAQQRSIRFKSGSSVTLDGDWRYRISGSLPQTGVAPHAPWLQAVGTTTLYNGMIAPLAGYSVRGAAWYQGEANAMEAAEYARLLPALMKDWRHAFGADLPFLVVQLAGFGAAVDAPSDPAWAALREVQRRAVDADGNAALAVAIDIGERDDIHPTNKQEVGRRLAFAARQVIFHENVVGAAPAPIEARRTGNQVAVNFSNAPDGLVVQGGNRPVGFELCDAKRHCGFIDATVQEDRVLLDAAAVPDPFFVRYGWANSPVCNLYNTNGLPAVPFEVPVR